MRNNSPAYFEKMELAKAKVNRFNMVKFHLFHKEFNRVVSEIGEVIDTQMRYKGSSRFTFNGEYYGDKKHKLVSLIPENRDKMESIMKKANILKYEQDFVMGYVSAALNICKNDADLTLLLPESLGQLFHPLIDVPTLTQEDVDNFKQVNAAAELRLKSHLLKLVLTN